MSVTYAPEARTAVTESLEHVTRVSIRGTDLDVLSGSIVFDEGRSPHVTLTLTVRAPDDQATLDSWDPLTFTRVAVWLGYRYPGGALDLPQVADLSLTHRAVRRPDGTVQLTAESDEALVGEHGRTGTDWTIGTAVEPVATIARIIREALPAAVIEVTAATRGATTGTVPLVLAVGDDPVRMLYDLADRGGDLWVHDDGLRTWQIRDRPVLGEAVAVLTVGASGTILGSETELSRDDWGNAVLVRHRWTDTDRTERVVTGYAQTVSGPYAVETVGRRLFVVDRDTPVDGNAASRSADSILSRVLSRGRSISLDAIATLWVRPGDTVTVQLPVGPQERHLVASVRFDLTTGRMALTTRTPTTAQITS